MEEVGSIGARLLVDNLNVSAAVVGDATGGAVAIGHRGRVELEVSFRGRSAHASIPERAANPHYAAARFLLSLGNLPMRSVPPFGTSTVAPTLYVTDQSSANVVPATALVTLDWRTVPGEDGADVLDQVAALAAAATHIDGGGDVAPIIQADARIVYRGWRTYTGLERSFASVSPAFHTPAASPLVVAAQEALETVLRRGAPTRIWPFATDGGQLAAAGIPTIGFGPGREALTHTQEERVSVDELRTGLVGTAALALRLGTLGS
jgi:acetylornithine deacetylase/succinyl-diaminopimelate desuccinylase-like protein